MTARRRSCPGGWRAAGLAALVLAVTGACTARQGYEGLQAGARNDCALQPASEYQRCLERLDMDYATYRAQPLPPDAAPDTAATARRAAPPTAADPTGVPRAADEENPVDETASADGEDSDGADETPSTR